MTFLLEAREAWDESPFGMQCRMCGRAFKRPQPHLHAGMRRWAVGFTQNASRKGLARALKTNHRRACPAYGPMLPVGWRRP